MDKKGIILVDDVVKDDYKNSFISNSSYIFLEYLKSQKKIKVDYIFKRIEKGKYVKYIAFVKKK